MKRKTPEVVALILAVTTALCILALVGAGTYAIIANTNDWVTHHIKGPNLTNPLSALIGSLLSAVIAGVVGYIGGVRVGRVERQTYQPTTFGTERSSVDEVLDRITRKGV